MVFHCMWSTTHVPHHGSPHMGALTWDPMRSAPCLPLSWRDFNSCHPPRCSLGSSMLVYFLPFECFMFDNLGVFSLVIFPVWDAFLPKVIQVSAPCYLSVSPSLTTWCRHITLCHTTPFYFFQNAYHYIFAWSNYLSVWEFCILSTITPLPESKGLIYFVHCISHNTYNRVWQ